MNKENLKKLCLQSIDAHKEDIIALGEDIFRHPELGFKERRTSQIFSDALEELGIPFRKGIARTGVKGRLAGAVPGPNVMLMGELDAVVSPLHPCADPETGAAHACGHNSQIAAVLGAAMGLAPLKGLLGGDVTFAAVPAEEYVELEFRQSLQEKGEIEFMGASRSLSVWACWKMWIWG